MSRISADIKRLINIREIKSSDMPIRESMGFFIWI